MSATPRLFCLDTVLIDVVLKVGELPKRAGDVLANETLITTGGGFNAMSAASRHGVSAVYAGRMGMGPFATIADRSLESEDIARPVERNESVDNGICIVLLEDNGERSFVTSPGAEATLRAEDLASLDVRDGDYVLVSGYNVMYPVQGDLVLEWLKKLSPGVLIVFDPATRMVDIPPANLNTMLALATWLDCNASEAATLAKEKNIAQAVEKIASTNDRLNVLVRDGERGCIVAPNHSKAEVVQGFATTVVDTNGAGDVHNGVFIAELIRGKTPAEAARWANAASAMAISVLGGAACPPRTDVEAFIEAS
jgi:sugar/nucleoside kinase (ribokinase family)